MQTEKNNNSKTLIVFVQDEFFLGGIEVLEMKIAKELVRRGMNVAIASRANGNLDAPDQKFSRIIHKGYPDFLSNTNKIVENDLSKLILVSLHPTAAIACEIAGRTLINKYRGKLNVHHFHWVSHSRAFFFSRRKIINKLFEAFFSILPEKSTYFMNDAALIAHQNFWKTPLRNFQILRIPGRTPAFQYQGSGEKFEIKDKSDKPKINIVSVGRLVSFKSYNLHAAEVTKSLCDAGIDARWDIWGYGPDENIIISNIRKYGMTDRVKIRGELPHELFDETVTSYSIFVGMGTSILEAANTGMPVCVAVENQGATCYGHLHQAPTDSVGDRVEGFPEQALEHFLKCFAMLSNAERRELGEKDALAARKKESTIDEFANAIIQASLFRKIGFFQSAFVQMLRFLLWIIHWKHERNKN